MENIISFNLGNPTNVALGKEYEITEGAMRARKSSHPELYEKNVRDFRLKYEPFISLKDYNLEKETDYKSEDVLNRKLTGAIIDRNTNEVGVPVNLNEMLFAKEQLRKFNEPSVISFSNFKGGVGKSLTAINIATTLSNYDFKVLLVDFDLQGNTTSMFDLHRYKKNDEIDLEINKLEELYDMEASDFKYTIVDLMAEAGKEKLPEMVREAIININDKTNTIGRLDILPNSCSIENVLKFEDIDKYLRNYGNINKSLDEVLSFVKYDYDFVIIDTPPSISLPLRVSAMASDYFIIVLTADKMAKDGIAPFLVPIKMQREAYKREKGKDISVLGGILNKYQGAIKIQQDNKDHLSDTLPINVGKANLGEGTLFNQNIKLSKALTQAQHSSGSVLVDNPSDPLVRDYFNLAEEIVDRVILEKALRLSK